MQPPDLEGLVRISPGMALCLGEDGRMLAASRRCLDALGPVGPGEPWTDAFTPLDASHPLHPYQAESGSAAALLTEVPSAPRRTVVAWLEVVSVAGRRVLLGHDVTGMAKGAEQLRASEHEYRRLVEGLADEYFFYRHGTDGVFTWVSTSVTRVLGYPPDEFRDHYALYFTDDPVNLQAMRHTELSIRGLRQPAYPVVVRHRDGCERHLEVVETPVVAPDGSVVAIEGLAHDVTERVRTEARLTQLVQERERLDRDKDSILALVAHDLQSPLTAIRGWAESALMLREDAKLVAAALERVITRCDAMSALIVRLLQAHAKDGRLQLVLEPEDAAACARAVVEDHAARASAKQLALELVVADGLPPALADRDALREVIDNLVSNAVKYSFPGGGIRIELASAGNRVHLTVRDAGPGLGADDQRRLFEPFARLSPRPTAGEGSVGLGLSIVKKLVDQMSGTIRYEGAPGRSSAFIVELPASPG